MELTEKAKKEIKTLEDKITVYGIDHSVILEAMLKLTDWKIRKYYQKDLKKAGNKIWKAQDKVEAIKKEGISTSERNALSKEAWVFTTIESDRSLGMTQYIKIGFSKVLNSYVQVELTRYSSFMSNVKGCGSLANKKVLDNFSITDKETYDEIIERNERKVSTSFVGYEEKIMPIK
jgi:hypothetical protein